MTITDKSTPKEYFATCPKGLENLLFQELNSLGMDSVRETVAGVYFSGTSIDLYRACLWSRLANKILLPLSNAKVITDNDLYEAVKQLDWENHITADGSFKVDFLGTTDAIRNTQFGAVRVKDAIVDRFQALFNERPSVSKSNPDLIINARLSKGKVHISLDLSGTSLHRRGYRRRQGEAPLKENLACAVLLRAQWPSITKAQGFLIDPMCGSATLLIEGLMMAADIAPGYWRHAADWGFSRWLQFDEKAWHEVKDDANLRKESGLKRLKEQGFECRGYDQDWKVINAAKENIERAGLEEWIRVAVKPIDEFSKPTHKVMGSGLVIANPPYGERLGEEETLRPVYRQLGQILRKEFAGWHSAIITSNPVLAHEIGIRAQKKYKMFNGTLAAECLVFLIHEDAFFSEARLEQLSAGHGLTKKLSAGAEMVANRIRKNQKQLRTWLKKESIECYRIYDADIPEYALAVDLYGSFAHVQEYAAPKSIDPKKAQERFNEALDGIQAALELDKEHIVVKQRRQNKGKQQYEKNESAQDTRAPFVVNEGRAQFWVDLWSYLDTGLFLDHRPVRKQLFHLLNQSKTYKRFLNLFCYTGSASVHAALGGAEFSISVDMSRTYLDWAKRNFELNRINTKHHHLIQQDCLTWLKDCRQGFDVIFLDPPSFSNSKRMEGVLDIQRDHVELITRCMDLLTPKGVLIFSTNLRSFKLDNELLEEFIVKDISKKTLDLDFQRNSKIHQCWVFESSS